MCIFTHYFSVGQVHSHRRLFSNSTTTTISFAWHSCFLIALAGLIVFSAAQITSSTTCGEKCQTRVLAAASFEAGQHAATDFSFYAIPSNFSKDLPPGTVLQVEDATDLSNYTVPSGLTMSRIIYTTVDLNGNILPASAYILWPYAPLTYSKCQKQGEYPLVAWAQGTSGVLKGCAPSNYRSLQYHLMAPYLLALQGMAVVAPDYAGLGFNALPTGEHIGHPWLNGPAQANDLANAVIAAQAAFPRELPSKGPFVAVGHSQGGGAAWSLAELLVSKPIAGYKGTVAIAPTTRTIDLLEQALVNSLQPWAGTLITGQPKIIEAVTALYPSYNYSGLTPTSADRWFNVIQPLQACLPTDYFAFQGVPLDQLAQAGWSKHDAVQNYGKRSETGRKEFKGPLLVIAGKEDTIVPHFTIESAVDDTCSMTNNARSWEPLEMVTYANMDHFPVIQASELKWLNWVKDRLTGKPLSQHGCVKNVMEGYRTET
ncbi:Alpha/Beta hydrolase protein [Lipomyces tetrasporus]